MSSLIKKADFSTRSKIVVSFVFLIFNLSFISSIIADDIKIQRVVSTGTENNCITQDKDGVLWIGVWGKGLFCYNGREVSKTKIGNRENLSPIIWSIFADSKGLIWSLVADHGLYVYDKKSGIYNEYKPVIGRHDTLVSNRFNVCSCNNLVEDKEGFIWIGTAEGLCSYNKKTKKFAQYKHNPDNPNSLSNNSVWAVFVDKDGLIWIGTEDGLNRYDKNIGKFYCYRHDPYNPESISDNYIRAIAEDKEGNLWIGTKNTGIDKLDKKAGKFTNYRHDSNNKNSLSYNEIHHIMVDRNNNLWICNDGNIGFDLYNIRTKIFKHYSYNPENSNTISSNSRLCSFEDSSGIVWLINGSGGLNKCIWQKNIFKKKSYNPNDKFSISSNELAKIYEDKNENIWLGTYRGGLCLYTKDDKFENFNHTSNPTSLPGTSVHSILNASDNKLWLGIKEGFLCLFDAKTKQIIKNFKNPYSNVTPAYLTKDNKNPDILWFACSYAKGVFKFDIITGEFTTYKYNPDDKSSVSNAQTFGILQDGDVLWLGTGGSGLCKFDKDTGKCVYYKHDPNDKNSISGNVVIEPYIDSKGNFWVATDNGGLNKFDKQTGKFTHYNTDCGFPSKCTRHILEDKEGFLWISTDSGIIKFDPQQLKVIRWFTTADGLPSNDFEDICNAIEDSKGNFWFSTVKGLCKFNPEEASKIEPNKHIPSIVLSSFKSKEGTYNEEGLKKLTEVKLPWPDNSFSFTFAGLDYMDPGKNQYAYKLEGFDKDWNYIGNNNFGQYSNLSPGEYILHMKGSNNDGIWNEEGISIRITITPPFWMTLWFKGLIGIVILCTIGGVFHLRIRTLNKKAIYMRDHAIAEATAQVAHDIRSPLAALNTALRDLKELPEQKRILIRNATRRISDIAHNLLIKYKKKNENTTGTEQNLKAELVSSLLDYLISEKRVQTTDKSIELILDIGNDARSCFVNLETSKFKRVISNLINNAAEAIETKEGIIRVVLTKELDSNLVLKIIDNGKGISEDTLLKIKQGKISSTKKEGCGLGISSSVQNIKSWGGSYDIQSKEREGTTFIIKLPITEAPDWFQNRLEIIPGMNVAVLDDDQSIHDVWETRFQEYIKDGQITLEHFYLPSEFVKYCEVLATPTCPAEAKSEGGSHAKAGQNLSSTKILFLIDYELLGCEETGLDLIEKLNLKNQSILVTSRYEEPAVKNKIIILGIKAIPKNFAPYILIEFSIF